METRLKFKPMLAARADLDDIRFPVLASPKLDGVRCAMVGGKALTRSLKPVPNVHVREWLEANCPNGWDGELMLYHRPDGTLPDFNEVQSAIMSRDGEPDFRFYVFDNYLAGEEFWERLEYVEGTMTTSKAIRLRHQLCNSREELEALVDKHLLEGYEGTMVRDPHGPYKFGRSTLKEGYLLKLKPFIDEEATVVGVEELMRNQNEQTRDERGYAKRSKAKDGMVPAGMLGALICRTDDGVGFNLGGGFTEQQRLWIWQECRMIKTGWPVGRRVTFKAQKPPGRTTREPGTAPRCPVFKGFRSQEDLS